MRKLLEFGGLIAAVVLIGFGISAIVIGANGRSTVHDSISQERITGTPDMTPATITVESRKAGLPSDISLPSCTVAGKQVTNGSRARCFATYMRIHALLATGGKTYSQMPRFATANGQGTNDPTKAQTDPKTGQPVDNPMRNVWVTETALSTALNTSYMAEQTAIFGIVVGIALLLAGIGFAVLTFAGALRRSGQAASA